MRLLVLNSALRWRPAAGFDRPGIPPGEPAGPAARSDSGPRRGRRGGGDDNPPVQQTGTLWVPDGTFVRPIHVNLGLSDGTWTEVQGEGLSEGMTVVLGVQTPDMVAEAAPGASPFIPQFGRRGGPGTAGPACAVPRLAGAAGPEIWRRRRRRRGQ